MCVCACVFAAIQAQIHQNVFKIKVQCGKMYLNTNKVFRILIKYLASPDYTKNDNYKDNYISVFSVYNAVVSSVTLKTQAL